MVLYYNFAAESYHIKKLCSRLYSIELECYSQARQIRFLSHLLGELGVTYAIHLQLDFLLAVIEHFTLARTVETS